jgi:hypothetical protein
MFSAPSVYLGIFFFKTTFSTFVFCPKRKEREDMCLHFPLPSPHSSAVEELGFYFYFLSGMAFHSVFFSFYLGVGIT